MKNKDEITRVQGYFRKFFDEYYPAHREIKSLSYRDMEDGNGFSAVLDYGSFIQYINYYCKEYGAHTINSCFLLENNGKPFICHFDDILDELLSEDISFYTFEKCVNEDRILNALNTITGATQFYFLYINDIAASPQRCESVFKETYGEDIELEGEEGYEIPSVPEKAYDFNYAFESALSDPKQLKKELERKHRKNKLETKFEKRAYNALSKLSAQEVNDAKKKVEKAAKYPLKHRILMAVPYIVLCSVFGVIFFIICAVVDDKVFGGCIGRDPSETALAFVAIGAIVGAVICVLFHDPIARLISGKRYEEMKAINASEYTKGSVILLMILAVIGIGCAYYFGFQGMAFKDGEIVYKKNGISALQSYSFEDVEIAKIVGSEGDTDDEYAFNIDGKWIDYYAIDEPEKQLIEQKTAGKELKTYEYFEDIEG